MEYQPSATVKEAMDLSGEPIPVTFIERKPHPNGLLAYLLSSYVVHPRDSSKKLPFIVDYLPYLQVDDINDGNVLQHIMNRYAK